MRKLIISIILALALFGNSYAQEEDLFFEINDFSKGLQSHVAPYSIKSVAGPGGASEAYNVRFNDEYGSLSKREKMLELSTCQTSAVKSLHRYYKSDDTDYIIQTSSTLMDYVNDTTGDCTEIDSALTDGKRWSWVTYKDIAIGMNGTDRAQKWDGKTQTTANTDGSRTASELTADLGAPFAELNTGSNLDASSWYQYKIAFYDGSTYSFSNARSNPIQTGSSVQDITLTDIPLGPAGTTARYIYRTVGDASKAAVLSDTSFYQVDEIADNTTRTYNDTVDDATLLGDAAPTWGTVSGGTEVTPPYGKLSLIHKERLFIANDPSGTESGKSTVYWSSPFNPDYFDINSDYELFRPDDGDEITFIKNLRNLFTIGKTNTILYFYTEDSSTDNWVISNPFSFIGCVAPYSAVNSPQGIFYLGRFGLYLFNGNTSELISDSVSDRIRDILATSLDEVFGIYHNNQYLLSYTSESSGASINNRVLILDTVRNSYVEDVKNVDSFVAFDSGNDYGTLYSGSSGTDGTVYAHSGGYNQLIFRYLSDLEDGTASDVYYGGTEESPYLSLGWDEDWTTVADTWADQGDSTWVVENNSGTWTSPIVEINASALDKLYWNESLGTAGNVTFAIRLAATSGGISGASYSSEFTTPSGSDISGETANNFIQIRASLSTTDYTEAPLVFLDDNYLLKLTYNRSGTGGESAILSTWSSGYLDLDGTRNPKRIKEIQVYYTGDSGTLNFSYANDQGNVESDFDIDMSVEADESNVDNYFGNGDDKIYSYILPVTDNNVGRNWKFTVSDNGVNSWKIRKIVVRFDRNAYIPMRG